MLHAPSAQPVPLDSANEADAAVIQRLKETMGDFVAEKLWGDSAWARAVLAGDTSGVDTAVRASATPSGLRPRCFGVIV